MSKLPPPPRPIEADAASKLRSAIERSGYTERIFQTLGMAGVPGWRAAMRANLSRLPTPECSAIASFFLIRDEVPEAELAPAVGGTEVLRALEASGLAARGASGWACPLQLIPGGGLFAFSDPIEDPASEDPPEEYILPIGRSTRYVDDLTVREPCDLSIDLGCGQGYLAMRSMAHAKRCIATDINPRAVAFARANASLLGVGERIECREGSLFDPLQDAMGQTDLLTCNPPFIILPGAQTTAAFAQLEGDRLLETLLRTTPQLLREDGWATIIGLWEHADQGNWVSRIQGWVEGNGCDVLVLQFRTYRPEEYFQQWFPPAVHARSGADFRSLVERRRIGAITFGGVVIRKRRGLNWLRSVFTLINARTGPGSDQLRAYFRTQTALETMASPNVLLNRRMRIAAGWRFDPARPLPQAAPALTPGAARGLPMPLQHAMNFEPMLAAFDGARPARQVLAELGNAGRLPMEPASAAAANMLLSLASAGALDLLE